MPNVFQNLDLVTKTALPILANSLVLGRNVDRQYDSQFGRDGSQIGQTIRIRKPDRMLVSSGPTLQVQELNQQYTTLTIDKQKTIGFSVTSAEAALNLQEFTDLIIKPRMSQIAAEIDKDIAEVAYQNLYHSVGTPGTNPSTSDVIGQASLKLNNNSVPRIDRTLVYTPNANQASVEGLKGLYNPADLISMQLREGILGNNLLGFKEYNMSQSIARHMTGTRNTAGTVSASVTTEGATSITLAGLGANNTVKKGDVFTIAGINMVNPQTRKSVGSLQQFVITADATANGSGVATVSVSPPMYSSGQALATITSLPTSGLVTTFLGAAGTEFDQNLAFHKSCITLATVELFLPEGASQASANGLSIRLIRNHYDAKTDSLVTRFDVVYGIAVQEPGAGVRIWGA